MTATPAYLSLGSNIDPVRHVREALDALRERFGAVRVSPAYLTRAVGFDGADFVNCVAIINSDLEPEPLNDWLHALEDAHGRDRGGPRYSDRTLDIDIVLFGDRELQGAGNLRLPRPELAHAFVLHPLADIAADVVVPGTGRTLGELWRAHPDYEAIAQVVALD